MCDHAQVTTAQSATPEGQIIRDARNRAGLTIPAAAARSHFSAAWWGDIERGYRRVRNETLRPEIPTLVAIAEAIPLTEDERDSLARARPDAAAALAGISTEEERDLDELTETLIPCHAASAMLRPLWHLGDGGGHPRRRAERVQLMLTALGKPGGLDSLIGELAAAHPRSDLLELLWGLEDGDGRRRARGERVKLMLGVIRGLAAPEQARDNRLRATRPESLSHRVTRE